LTKVLKIRFEKLYRSEHDSNVKERMLLVLNVVYDKQVPAQVAKDPHRSKTWASDWLKRYREEGIEGLKNRAKSGRPPDISPDIIYERKNELASSKQGWTTNQVQDLIVRKSGRIRYHYTHIYRLMYKWGFKQKLPRKTHVSTASKKEKNVLKKSKKDTEYSQKRVHSSIYRRIILLL
jgi:putative transposase